VYADTAACATACNTTDALLLHFMTTTHTQTYIELGDLSAALSACEHVTQQHDCHDVQALAVQGEVLVALGRHDEAAAVLTRIESL
jgi:hypothetical protein